MKYFKICEGYELKSSWLLVDTHHHTCAKFAVFSPTLSQISQKKQSTVTKICRFLNIFYTKIVVAPVLDDTLNLLKESLISTYLISTSLLFIEHHDQFLVLNQIWTERKVHIFQNIAFTTPITKGLRLQKMNIDVRKKKEHKCPAGCQPLPQKLGFFIPLEHRKTKSLVLRLGQLPPFPHPPPRKCHISYLPFPASSSLCTPEGKQRLNKQKWLLFSVNLNNKNKVNNIY